jgi:tRNA nucleotidyltransferase (CCA-adding enzyme)
MELIPERLDETRLPSSLRERIATIADVSRRQGTPAYLVGGFVRDLLLERENRDLDVVVEGDGMEFAARLAEALGARARTHPAFLTAVVTEPEGFLIDVATARSELYSAPAALPEVRPATLRQDLFRRDFTVNTLAIRLGPEPGYGLIDLFGGRRDLEEKTLRVLHDLSFLDDPTRILRAVRLESRLGFQLSPETLRLAQEALAGGVFDYLSGSRLREELAKLLREPDLAHPGIERLAGLGVLRGIDPLLELDDAARERLQAARGAHDWYRREGIAGPLVEAWRLPLMALVARWGEKDLERLAGRLLLAGEERRLLASFPARLEMAGEALQGVKEPHQAAEALDPLTGEELLLLMGEGDETVGAHVRHYLTGQRPLTLSVRGADLLAAGVPPGPRIGEALRATRRARLDGRIDPDGELRYALAWLSDEVTTNSRRTSRRTD